MDVGILYHNAKRYPPNLAIAIGARQFSEAGHTRGHIPQVAMFNPLDLPEATEIHGLQVQANHHIPVRHIRICTREMTPEEEFSAELAALDRLVSRAGYPGA